MANSSSKKPRCSRCRPSANSSLLAAAILLLANPFTLLSQAQTSSVPLTVSGPAFARTATRLYVLGGQYATINYGQFFSLDLANSWNSTTPLWTQLNDGPQQTIFPAVFSADQKTMVTFHSGNSAFAYHYSVVTGQWTRATVQAQYGDYQGIGAVTDPNTGLVYLAGGYTSADRNSMNVYNFVTDTIVCALDFSVVHIGRLSNNTFSGEIFIFDTVSQTWRQGLTGPPRLYTACTIAGTQLLVWGGVDSTNTAAPAAVLIYDLNNNAWITQYTPPASYVAARASETISSSPNATSTSSPSNDGSSSSNAGATAGGVVAGVAVLCAGVLFFVFRRRQQQHKAIPLDTASDHMGSEGSGWATPPPAVLHH
ncbi:hypothetical protein BC939DRAFT_475146 [Gamsiella multidivaricata]|uniref:uncharacterized protein n=1 Tax=Gamsiella multidivaricata TaxID=101098 RepID=UPI00221FCCFE|nr:uncharacterized protein BC939DRAFT_475146 [Gamsiella multidivaricata]KAI7827543.1 hypothetical protein BC939DRAFT_475146 [Gamsiella multidivaricata]